MIKKAQDIRAEIEQAREARMVRHRPERNFDWVPDLITVREAAKILGVHRTTVRRLIPASLTYPVHRWHRAEVERLATKRAKRLGTGLGSYEELGIPRLGPEHPSQ